MAPKEIKKALLDILDDMKVQLRNGSNGNHYFICRNYYKGGSTDGDKVIAYLIEVGERRIKGFRCKVAFHYPLPQRRRKNSYDYNKAKIAHIQLAIVILDDLIAGESVKSIINS